jgi:hypothetical protein
MGLVATGLTSFVAKQAEITTPRRPSETSCGIEVGEETIAGSRTDPDLAEPCGVAR